MKMYYFNVRWRHILFEDREGALFADIRQAWKWALADARRLFVMKVMGNDGADCEIQVCDESRAVVAIVPLIPAQVTVH